MVFSQCVFEIGIRAWVGGQGIKVSISIRQSWLFKLLYANFSSGFLYPFSGSGFEVSWHALSSLFFFSPVVLADVGLIVSNKKWRELARAKWLEMQISGR